MDYEQRSPTDARADARWDGSEQVRDSRPDSRPADSYRRRSPDQYERRGARGPRNRSRSPAVIDRYQPAGRRDDRYARRDYPPRDRDDRRRAGTPPSIDRYVPGQDPPQIRINPMPNPIQLDYQVGFNFFAEWWRMEQNVKEDEEFSKTGRRRPAKDDTKEGREKERSQIQAAYDSYKEELQGKMAKSFVLAHKNQEWFRERYVPDVREPFRKRLSEFRDEPLQRWKHDLAQGVFDSFTLEGIYKNESNGAGGVLEREEGETVGAAEVLGVGDLVPSRGGDLRDEAAQQPALLIKTLAPMVARPKIEEFCKEHLGENQGGFKWLSLSDPNPQKKCYRMGWIMLHPAPEGDVPMDRDEVVGDEDGVEDGEKKGGLLTTAEKALDAINGKTIVDEERGNFTCHVGVHFPPKEPRKKALWDLFSAPERIERDVELAKRLVNKLDDEHGGESSAHGVDEVNARVEQLRENGSLKAQYEELNAAKSSKQSKTSNGDAMDADVASENGEMSEGEAEEDEVIEEESDDEDLLVQKKTLDLLVEYLRRVYNFCFFCVFECDSVHELTRKCPGGHLRRPKASLSKAAKEAAQASAKGEKFTSQRRESTAAEDAEPVSPIAEKSGGRGMKSKNEQQLQRAFNWVKTFEDKLLQILDPDSVELKKLGGIALEEGLNEELKKYIKQEDEAKYRCRIPECTKLFKGESFWRKHVEKRHGEFFENMKTDFELVNNYVLDPAHIAPSRSDATSNGHFPTVNSGMQAGTPRGFNLQQHMPPMMGMPGGMAGMPGYGMPGYGGAMMGLPMGQSMMAGNGMHGAGPMRRGRGSMSGTRPPGPYDRRQPRYGAMPGQMGGMSIAGAPGMRTGGRWGDGAGSMAVGPKEAVQGRSLKSYEDLDAVGAGGGGELDY